MTNEEKVKAVYPDAEVYLDLRGGFAIGVEGMHLALAPSKRTREEAWKAAASRLPASGSTPDEKFEVLDPIDGKVLSTWGSATDAVKIAQRLSDRHGRSFHWRPFAAPPSVGEKPATCPFCGMSDLKIIAVLSDDEPKRIYANQVFCNVCHARGRCNYPIGWTESERAAIEAWNDRPSSTESQPEQSKPDPICSNKPVITNGQIGSVSDRVTLYQDPDNPWHFSNQPFITHALGRNKQYDVNDVLENAAKAAYDSLSPKANMTQITAVQRACKAIRELKESSR